MDQKEYEARLVAIEQIIETLARGYQRGSHFQILGMLEETAQEHDRLYNGSDVGSGGRYHDADARGCREGCRETKPERTS
ncbi:MAG: hypothetical protein ACM3OG_00540 [Actinomycetota bacterium]